MGILSQIMSDYRAIKGMIEAIELATFSKDGKIITGKEREQLVEDLAAEKKSELTQLRILLLTGVSSSYISPVTGKEYKASPEELKHIEERFFQAGKHSIFPQKLSRTKTLAQRSQFELYNSPSKKLLSFFIEHKSDHSYPSGSFAAKVKKAYTAADEATPNYAVKIFKKYQFTSTLHELRIAMRGAYCNRLLGRTGYAFRRNMKTYIVTDWLAGKPLCSVDPKIITAMPIQKRINLALMLINEIAILHKHGIIHCDIKPENVMLSDNALHLFDLDSVRLETENITTLTDGPMFTPSYLDGQINYDIKRNPSCINKVLNKNSDLFSSGITLTYLFPDILLPISEKLKISLNSKVPPDIFEYDGFLFKLNDKYKENERLGKLIGNLLDKQENRPTTEEVHSELSKLSNSYSVDKEVKAELKETTPPAKLGASSSKSRKAFIDIERGRNAFIEIERELLVFGSQYDKFNESFRPS